MLTSWHLNEKAEKVCIKAGSPLSTLALSGQVVEYETVKWPIAH